MEYPVVILFKNKNILGQDQCLALGDSQTDWILRRKTVPTHCTPWRPQGQFTKRNFSHGWKLLAPPCQPLPQPLGVGSIPRCSGLLGFEQYLHHSPHTAVLKPEETQSNQFRAQQSHGKGWQWHKT